MKKLCLSLVMASIGSLALTNSAMADDVNEIYNPNPQKDGVVLSMPCDGIMVFRKVYTSNDPKKIKDKNIDLFLAGHSLNGQVRLPFIGSIYTPTGAKKYYDSKYKIDNTEIYISNGLGTSKIPYRLNNRPSINLYRFYNN